MGHHAGAAPVVDGQYVGPPGGAVGALGAGMGSPASWPASPQQVELGFDPAAADDMASTWMEYAASPRDFRHRPLETPARGGKGGVGDPLEI